MPLYFIKILFLYMLSKSFDFAWLLLRDLSAVCSQGSCKSIHERPSHLYSISMISKHKNWPKFSLVVATHVSVSQTFDRCPIVLRVDWRGVISQKGSPRGSPRFCRQAWTDPENLRHEFLHGILFLSKSSLYHDLDTFCN